MTFIILPTHDLRWIILSSGYFVVVRDWVYCFIKCDVWNYRLWWSLSANTEWHRKTSTAAVICGCRASPVWLSAQYLSDIHECVCLLCDKSEENGSTLIGFASPHRFIYILHALTDVLHTFSCQSLTFPRIGCDSGRIRRCWTHSRDNRRAWFGWWRFRRSVPLRSRPRWRWTWRLLWDQ